MPVFKNIVFFPQNIGSPSKYKVFPQKYEFFHKKKLVFIPEIQIPPKNRSFSLKLEFFSKNMFVSQKYGFPQEYDFFTNNSIFSQKHDFSSKTNFFLKTPKNFTNSKFFFPKTSSHKNFLPRNRNP
jgi:hypothetical protein